MVKVSLMLLSLALSLAGCGALAESQTKSLVPCDAHDHAAQLDLTANAAKSKQEREQCNGDQDCIKAVLAERDAYVDERCKLPEEK